MCLKGNSKIKEKFFKKILTQKIRKTYFLTPKLGVDSFMGKYGTSDEFTKVSRISIVLKTSPMTFCAWAKVIPMKMQLKIMTRT